MVPLASGSIISTVKMKLASIKEGFMLLMLPGKESSDLSGQGVNRHIPNEPTSSMHCSQRQSGLVSLSF